MFSRVSRLARVGGRQRYYHPIELTLSELDSTYDPKCGLQHLIKDPRLNDFCVPLSFVVWFVY
ncbi:tRNA 5-methylaminomethyl-2-thiouridine biosynthesis bifunctional MnmC [Gossypium arboreum]|uniref:tRNA 5-methylaminomethyl-2-thiouridine biosynthesis bifunctional MnmC n=1 Tax=Gossypium arboreum TaxID=29729 RepID=A0A0B0PJA5_GOSAR|nr:tRNA 5-methylaminomethyl-2-thiouridine biosynthesis bifunctional MnmC [Gossypium arboreum]